MSLERYIEPVKLPFELPTSVYGAMLVIWQLNPGLQRKFPLHYVRRSDYVRFLAWCVYSGRKKYKVLREIPAWEKELRRPVALRGSIRVTDDFNVAMLLGGVVLKKYHNLAFVACHQLRKEISMWYEASGCNRACLDGCIHIGGTQNAYEITDRKRLLPLFVKKHLLAVRNKLARPPTESEVGSVVGLISQSLPTGPMTLDAFPYGVNLYGYAKGELGIGEDVRMVARALELVGVPFCIINVQPGKDVSQMDESVLKWLVERPIYGISMFCMTGIEHARFVVEGGLRNLKGRYIVGLWPWELPQWPKSWLHACELVNEIWGISSYTTSSYRLTGVPSYTMPLAVSLGEISKVGRDHFKLPENTYLYFFSFDYNSTMSRKNPEALFEAFISAFPLGSNYNVGLVLKVSHAKKHHKRWQRFMRRIRSDSRVILIDSILRKAELLALYNCCDCLVSLHRAEGFGRAMVESILLDKQVIATNFSGNLDFCDPQRVGLVDCTMKSIGDKEYFYSSGQSWAEPSIKSAVKCMRQIYSESGKSGTECVARYSLESAGMAYKKKLRGIYYGKQVLSYKNR